MSNSKPGKAYGADCMIFPGIYVKNGTHQAAFQKPAPADGPSIYVKNGTLHPQPVCPPAVPGRKAHSPRVANAPGFTSNKTGRNQLQANAQSSVQAGYLTSRSFPHTRGPCPIVPFHLRIVQEAYLAQNKSSGQAEAFR